MLLSFSVKNFRSFGEEQTLSLIASNRLTDHPKQTMEIPDSKQKALRAAVIYGANAAGKSNLIAAIHRAQALLKSRRLRPRLAADVFRFKESPDELSEFEFQFATTGKVWTYSFSVLQNEKIVSESLFFQDNGEFRSIFSREDSTVNLDTEIGDLFPADKKIANFLATIVKLEVKDGQLFLAKIGAEKPSTIGPTLSSVFKWLTRSLVVWPEREEGSSILSRLQEENDFRLFAQEFLSHAGTGIGSLLVEETELEKGSYDPQFLDLVARSGHFWHNDVSSDFRASPTDGKVFRRSLNSSHRVGVDENYVLPFSAESKGTRRLLELMPVLFNLASNDGTFVIDEFDTSLHPLLCREFVRFFGESCSGARSQLIVTTHEANLLDQALLRRDEYWFVEKDEKHQSVLTSLADYQIRNDMKIEKGYLQGRFQAIPVFGDPERLNALFAESVG